MSILALGLIAYGLIAPAAPDIQAGQGQTFGAQTATLANGLQVVVIPNSRIPVVTHMMWFKAGSANEKPGVSGIAHFLEHLMFKGTPLHHAGSYSRQIASLGGQDNAFTSHDYTAFFFTVARDKLNDVMALEADRLQNIAPLAADVLSERDVILEERKQRIDNDPLAPYSETLYNILFPNHPYGRPIIGWEAEMARLTWTDARDYIDTWYAPNNAVLILSGDITLAGAVDLAQRHYGSWKKREVPAQPAFVIPALPGVVSLRATDAKVHENTLLMIWRAPSYTQDYNAGLALDIMTEMLDGGLSTRLYQSLVVHQKKAVSVGLYYDGTSRSDGVIVLTATPQPGVTLEDLDIALRQEFAAIAATPPATPAIALAKKRLYQNSVFQRDSVSGPAMIIGQAISSGLTLDQVENWDNAIKAAPNADIQKMIQRFFSQAAWSQTPPLQMMITAGAPSSQAPQ